LVNYGTLFVFNIHTSNKFRACPNNSVVRFRDTARGRNDLWEKITFDSTVEPMFNPSRRYENSELLENFRKSIGNLLVVRTSPKTAFVCSLLGFVDDLRLRRYDVMKEPTEMKFIMT
jgi:hypothetical protein